MNSLLNQLERLARWATALAGAGLFLMMAVGALDVVSGKLLGRPLPGAFEANEALLAACALLPLARVRSLGGHIRVDVLAGRFPAKARRALVRFGDALSLGLFSVLAWQGWLYAARSLSVLEYQAGPISFPVYPAKIMLALAMTLMALYSLGRLLAPAAREDAG
jgi:TRAP-type C4-dicarboxylate transport system permease small subunit